MAVTDWVAAPTISSVPEGYNALHRIWVLSDSVTAPLVPYNVVGVQNMTTTTFTPGNTKPVYNQGAGEDDSFEKRSLFQHDLTVQMLSGEVETLIARIKNKTMGTDYALPMVAGTDPVIHWELIVRKPDGTHLFSKVWRNLIMREWKFDSPMEDEVVDVPFYSKLSPFMLYTGSELVVDKYTGDGSTTDFTLSGSPLNLTDASDEELQDWYYDELVQVNYKLTTDTYGKLEKTGWSNATDTLSRSVAPVASSVVTATYVKAVA